MAVVIPIAGKARAGKGSVADILKERLEAVKLRVLIINYGDYLKFASSAYFGWNGEKDEEGRSLLQKIGTDIARKRSPDFWADIVIKFISVFSPDFDVFLIPDTRFPNEIIKHTEPIFSIRVHRTDFESELTEEQKSHLSETALDNWNFDLEIFSKSGLDYLSNAVDENIGTIYYFVKEQMNV